MKLFLINLNNNDKNVDVQQNHQLNTTLKLIIMVG